MAGNTAQDQLPDGFQILKEISSHYCGWWRLQKYEFLFRRLDAYERTLSRRLPSHSWLREQLRSKCTRNLVVRSRIYDSCWIQTLGWDWWSMLPNVSVTLNNSVDKVLNVLPYASSCRNKNSHEPYNEEVKFISELAINRIKPSSRLAIKKPCWSWDRTESRHWLRLGASYLLLIHHFRFLSSSNFAFFLVRLQFQLTKFHIGVLRIWTSLNMFWY